MEIHHLQHSRETISILCTFFFNVLLNKTHIYDIVV